jgi:hypothetical protein
MVGLMEVGENTVQAMNMKPVGLRHKPQREPKVTKERRNYSEISKMSDYSGSDNGVNAQSEHPSRGNVAYGSQGEAYGSRGEVETRPTLVRFGTKSGHSRMER